MTTLTYITIGIVILLFIVAIFWPDGKKGERISQKDNTIKIHVKVNLDSLDDLSLQALRVLLNESLSTNQCEINTEAFERLKEYSFKRLEEHEYNKEYNKEPKNIYGDNKNIR